MCDTQNGWVNTEEDNSGTWYYYEDGEVTTGWKDINGSTYYFNKPGGSMGWSKEVDGKYLGSDGRQVKDERWVNTEEDNSGTWYYVGDNERTVTGWNKVGDDFHYFNYPGGSMTGDNTIDGFNMDSDGKIVSGTGWLKDGYSEDWYHYSDGQMTKGWEQEGQTWYYLKDDGKMATGWEQVGGDWYYFHSDGTMATGWVETENGWYYLYSNGSMAWGKTVDGYHLNSSGKMVTGTGWQYIDDSWYYLKGDGTVAINWKYINDNWYYLYPEGSMAWNTTVDGYSLNDKGEWQATDVDDESGDKIAIPNNKNPNRVYVGESGDGFWGKVGDAWVSTPVYDGMVAIADWQDSHQDAMDVLNFATIFMHPGGPSSASGIERESEVLETRSMQFANKEAEIEEIVTKVVGKPDISRKLEYIFGNATGSTHNIERSIDMERKLNKIGIFNNAEGREFMTEELEKAFYDTNGIIQENGRVIKESLIEGPNGMAKMQSIWDGDRLITMEIFKSDWKSISK